MVTVGCLRRKEVPTFDSWFNGRFWDEWVVGRKNKPSEVESKKSIYRVHLKDAFGSKRLDEIQIETIAVFRASLVRLGRSEKTINNILSVLSKALRYAEDVRLIERAPKMGLFRPERPEIIAWSVDEYVSLREAAKNEEPCWYAAICLAGEAGLRIGEIRALDWQRDIDLVAGTLTVNRQTRHGETGTPKGRTRRVVPMTDRLITAIKGQDTIRRGYVVQNRDGSPLSDNQTKYWCYRICDGAGLPKRGWHILRHAFATHAAMFGVNPWKLMTWMGHKKIDETMRYVQFADDHHRSVPSSILNAGEVFADPNQRIIAMLGARGNMAATEDREETEKQKTP